MFYFGFIILTRSVGYFSLMKYFGFIEGKGGVFERNRDLCSLFTTCHVILQSLMMFVSKIFHFDHHAIILKKGEEKQKEIFPSNRKDHKNVLVSPFRH